MHANQTLFLTEIWFIVDMQDCKNDSVFYRTILGSRPRTGNQMASKKSSKHGHSKHRSPEKSHKSSHKSPKKDKHRDHRDGKRKREDSRNGDRKHHSKSPKKSRRWIDDTKNLMLNKWVIKLE